MPGLRPDPLPLRARGSHRSPDRAGTTGTSRVPTTHRGERSKRKRSGLNARRTPARPEPTTLHCGPLDVRSTQALPRDFAAEGPPAAGNPRSGRGPDLDGPSARADDGAELVAGRPLELKDRHGCGRESGWSAWPAARGARCRIADGLLRRLGGDATGGVVVDSAVQFGVRVGSSSSRSMSTTPRSRMSMRSPPAPTGPSTRSTTTGPSTRSPHRSRGTAALAATRPTQSKPWPRCPAGTATYAHDPRCPLVRMTGTQRTRLPADRRAGIERDRRWPHQDRSALDRDNDRPHVPNRCGSPGWEP
jgi:hypothetical protein